MNASKVFEYETVFVCFDFRRMRLKSGKERGDRLREALKPASHAPRGFQAGRPYNGAALSPRALDSFEASDAITMTTAIKAITSVQMALISGLTPSRTSE